MRFLSMLTAFREAIFQCIFATFLTALACVTLTACSAGLSFVSCGRGIQHRIEGEKGQNNEQRKDNTFHIGILLKLNNGYDDLAKAHWLSDLDP